MVVRFYVVFCLVFKPGAVVANSLVILEPSKALIISYMFYCLVYLLTAIVTTKKTFYKVFFQLMLNSMILDKIFKFHYKFNEFNAIMLFQVLLTKIEEKKSEKEKSDLPHFVQTH